MPEFERKEIEKAIIKVKSRLKAKLQSSAGARVADICLSEDGRFVLYSYKNGKTNKVPVINFMRAVASMSE